jgi:hypothetical protein
MDFKELNNNDLLFCNPHSISPPRNVVERETYLEFGLIATSALSSELD